GTDFTASLNACQKAAAWCRARRGPAMVHAHVIRPYSHSLSDDERLYKTRAEREREAERDPLKVYPECLIREGISDRRELDRIMREADAEVQDAIDRALQAAPPDRGSSLRFLYSNTIDPASPRFEA